MERCCCLRNTRSLAQSRWSIISSSVVQRQVGPDEAAIIPQKAISMTVRGAREQPASWSTVTTRVKRRWLLPFITFEWVWDWVAYFLSCWSFLEVLDYLGRFSILVAVIFYFSESGNRIKQKHYQAWKVINTAQGKGAAADASRRSRS